MVVDTIESSEYRRFAKNRRESVITDDDIKEVITQMHRLFIIAKQSIRKL